MKWSGGPGILAGVVLGGAIGAAARHGIFMVAGDRTILALLLVNLSGALLLGFLVGRLDPSGPTEQDVEVEVIRIPSLWRNHRLLTAVLGVGGLGAFTTYSGFVLEIVRLAQQESWVGAGALLLACLASGPLAVAVGLRCGSSRRD